MLLEEQRIFQKTMDIPKKIGYKVAENKLLAKFLKTTVEHIIALTN
jgi:hypothetical protein